MKRTIQRLAVPVLTLALGLASAALAPQFATAQTYPTKPITMIVP
jgi:tripartite-type tricarboxylate transporter receptor subunit TctC